MSGGFFVVAFLDYKKVKGLPSYDIKNMQIKIQTIHCKYFH